MIGFTEERLVELFGKDWRRYASEYYLPSNTHEVLGNYLGFQKDLHWFSLD